MILVQHLLRVRPRPTMIITRHRTIRTNPPTVILPSHEIATADIPVATASDRVGGSSFSGPKPAASDPAAVPVARNNPRADIDTLRLDYPDPSRAVAPASRPVRSRAPVRSKAKNERPAAKLACTGRIRKEETDHYLISIDGRIHLLQQGESAGGFTLRQIRNDSLVMVRDTECYLVKIP